MATVKTNTKVAKSTTKKSTTKKSEVKKTETKKVDNKAKANKTVSIDEVMKMYKELGIKCYNPEAKGNYRIMGSKKGSSLNLQSTKYIIYSTDVDFAEVKSVEKKYQDLVLIEGGNSQDKSRPNKVEITAVETLKAVLKLYAKNPLNQVVATK